MNYVYLDWNVFNQIEKNLSASLKNDVFSHIESAIRKGEIICPYSNAHINDLLRGYDKNPAFIDGHIDTLQQLTNGLYVCQYWGDDNIVWDNRNVREAFNEALEEFRQTPKTFNDFLNKESTKGLKRMLDMMRHINLPSQFDLIFESDPAFAQLFPKAKINKTMFSLLEDIFETSYKTKNDHSLYIASRKFFNQNKNLLTDYQSLLTPLNDSAKSKYMSDNLWEKHGNKNKTSYNPFYQELTNAYCKIDFRGENSDAEFPNLIDDALHVFYGAHCSSFISTDKKCRYKAAVAYKELDIKTKVFTPDEFSLLV